MSNNRLQWFIDRIGQKVYRNTTCGCNVCAMAHLNGLIIDDEAHANYLYACEGISNMEGYPLQYFDNKEDADKFELSHLSNS